MVAGQLKDFYMLEDQFCIVVKEQRRAIDEGSRSFADRRMKQLGQQMADLQSQLVRL